MKRLTLDLINYTYKITKRLPFSFIKSLGERVYLSKDSYIFKVLDELNIEESSYDLSPPELFSDKIWICWFQGEEEAPEIVKKCINSVRKHASGDEVIILTEENITDFVTIPNIVLEKYRDGQISKTHFSDIVRLNLLAQQGGLWVDATVFMTRDLDLSLYFHSDFVSLKHSTKISPSFDTGYWTTYFVYVPRKFELVQYTAMTINKYIEEYDSFIDYFLQDYIISKAIKDLDYESYMEERPILGNNRWLLSSLANQIATSELLSQFKQDVVGIYKLTYKTKYIRKKNSRETIYKKIVEDGECLE